MTELCPSLFETKKILERLRQNKSEASDFDFKGTLNLNTHGDHASFIRHIVALANLGHTACLFIGIEDKTWIIKGIPVESSLLNVDITQQQMNQILAEKIDPPIYIQYRVYEIDGLSIGVVGLEGRNLPYIISIDKLFYGGKKTNGKDSYIYKGVIYFRRGTDSIPASHQGEIFEVLNGKRDYVEIVLSLIFIVICVAIGVGVEVSMIKFANVHTAVILGGMLGILFGWILNKRLSDSMGRFSIGPFEKIVKNTSGLILGGLTGSILSYVFENSIIAGKMVALDPISMGLIVVFVSIWLILIIIVYTYFLNLIFRKIRKR